MHASLPVKEMAGRRSQQVRSFIGARPRGHSLSHSASVEVSFERASSPPLSSTRIPHRYAVPIDEPSYVSSEVVVRVAGHFRSNAQVYALLIL